MASDFVHLHTHTDYSLLDGAARIDELVAAAAADGQTHLAITDHGWLAGTLDFQRSAEKAGITPILGMEAYFTPDRKQVRTVGRKRRFHLVLLAVSEGGWRSLARISSLAYINTPTGKPLVDYELLAANATGLVATTACLGGLVPQLLLDADKRGAVAELGRLQDIFGQENVFVEIQDHGIADQRSVLPLLVNLARYAKAPLLATNDSHYTRPEEARAHDAMLCLQTDDLLSNPNRFHLDGHGHHLRTAAEMRALFADYPEACDNTLAIAERVVARIPTGMDLSPHYPVPEHETEASYLRRLANEGLAVRYHGDVPQDAQSQLNSELESIESMDLPGYFLIVSDLTGHARTAGIPLGPGRGSAAGCLVAFALGITEVNPLAHGLMFERFLNPGRKQMPDIDLDFDDRYRDQMISYAMERFGADRTAQISTFSVIKARRAIRDAAKVLEKPYGLADRLAKLVPPAIAGREPSLRDCLEDDGSEDSKRGSDLRDAAEQNADARELLELAVDLEGLHRDAGKHAAAVALCREPLVDVLPVRRDEGRLVTQWSWSDVEAAGLLKMDFLGLRTVGVIDEAIAIARSRGAAVPDAQDIPLEDQATIALLASGETRGVFQLESGPIRQLLRQMNADRFEDIVATIALYRPGPMGMGMHTEFAERKAERRPVTYIDPDAKSALEPTLGILVYQEQMMALAQQFAGYSLVEADNLRKACSKKVREIMEAEREKFLAGCVANGYREDLGSRIFDLIEPFADYGFNKSHAVAYAMVSWRAAYLLAHHELAYLSAMCSSVADDPDRLPVYLAECRQRGVAVLPPDVDASDGGFSPAGERSIRFGLGAIKGVGQGVVEAILSRREDGPVRGLADLARRLGDACDKKALEALVEAGALDALGPRAAVAAGVEEAVALVSAERRAERVAGGTGQLFELAPGEVALKDVPADPIQLLTAERYRLGAWLSAHPLDGREDELVNVGVALPEAIAPEDAGRLVKVAGALLGVESRSTKRGDMMATASLEGHAGSIRLVVFPQQFSEVRDILTDGAVVLAEGQVTARDEAGLELRVRSLTTLGAPASVEPVRVSGGREPPPPALAEPDVNVSAHPAPTVQPSGSTPTRQWAKRRGERRATPASQIAARR